MQPLPTIPTNMGRIDLRYGPSTTRVCTNTLWWFGPSTLPAGWTFLGWHSGIMSHWYASVGFYMIPDGWHCDYWAFYNDGVTTHSEQGGLFSPSGLLGGIIDPALCFGYWRDCTIAPRAYKGWWMGFPVCELYISHGTFNTAGLIAATNSASQYLAGWNSFVLGIYVPALYSVVGAGHANIQKWTSFNRPRYRYRRRAGRDRDSIPYTYPFVP